MSVLILSASLKFSVLSLCVIYYSIVACRDIFIYLFSVAMILFFAAIQSWFDSWWQVGYSILLPTVMATLSYLVFELPSFVARRHDLESKTTPVHRFNRNIIFLVELIILAASFLLVDEEIGETSFPIGSVMITSIFLAYWFLFVLLVEWLESVMYRTYFFLVVNIFTILFAHSKIYVSLYLVSSVACVGAFLVWGAISLLIALRNGAKYKMETK